MGWRTTPALLCLEGADGGEPYSTGRSWPGSSGKADHGSGAAAAAVVVRGREGGERWRKRRCSEDWWGLTKSGAMDFRLASHLVL